MSYRVTCSAGVLAAAGLLVGACGAERPNVGPDTEPPELAIVSDVPLYTRAQSVSLSVKASDVTGVKHVWYAVNNGSPIEVRTDAPQQAGALSVVAGTCEAGLTANTPNVVAIWAEDYAGNSGVSGQPPYMQVRTIVQSDAALGVSLNGAAQATYYDESKMTVGTETPPVYSRNGTGLKVVAPAETIHKAATRLAARPPATTSPADLEGSNPDNLPWLQFKVSLTGSPLATATYAIKAKVGSTTKEYSGALLSEWLSPQSSAGAMSGDVYFDLPLDSVRIPVLTTAVGAVTLTVAVHVSDAAGNEGGNEVELKYAVIGPPLNVVVDAGYPGSGDRKSSYAYKITDRNYGTLFNANDFTTFDATQQVRLTRVEVRNPGPQPVALDVSDIRLGSWTMRETWSGSQGEITGSASEITATFNAKTCPGDNQFAKDHLTMYLPAVNGSLSTAVPELASLRWDGVAATSNLSNLAEFRDGSAVPKVGGRYIVPAASGAPAVVYLYVARPLVVSRAGAPALSASAPYQNTMGTLYTYESERNSPISCCEAGEQWVPLLKCHRDIVGMGVDYCVMPTSCGKNCWSGSCGGGVNGQFVYSSVCGTGTQVCPVGGWNGTNIGPGSPCTNCIVGTERWNACSCSRWAQAQTYKKSRYFQELLPGAASEAVTVTFRPVTQPTDNAGNVYGTANEEAAGVDGGGSFTH